MLLQPGIAGSLNRQGLVVMVFGCGCVYVVLRNARSKFNPWSSRFLFCIRHVLILIQHGNPHHAAPCASQARAETMRKPPTSARINEQFKRTEQTRIKAINAHKRTMRAPVELRCIVR